eukprot:6172776-Pleurochrysis_carterae.AAC.1
MPSEYLIHLTSKEKLEIKKRIPEGQHIIKKALEAFWNLKLKMTKESSKIIPADHLLAFPIFHNPLFRIRKQLQSEWNLHPHLARIDTILTEKGEHRSITNIKQIIKELLPNIETRSLKKLINHAQSIQKRIPTWFKKRLDTERKWEKNEIVKFKDDINEDQYGIYADNTLQQLRVNASGHGTPTGTPWDTKEWDRHTEFTKTATWGTKAPHNHSPAIRGAQHETYPPNEGWLTANGQPIKLTDLTIKRMTLLFTPKAGPPSCQNKWDQILHTQIEWKKVWCTLSNNFSNPYDTKTWFKLIHRGLRLNGNDKTVNNNRCRLCNQARESHVHLLTCNKLNHLRRLVLKLLRATGLNLDFFAYPQTWLTCLNEHNEPLNNVQVALITIHWNVLYKHMTKQKLDNKTFCDRAALKEYARTISAGGEGGGGERALPYWSPFSSTSAPLCSSWTRSRAQEAAAPTRPAGRSVRASPHDAHRRFQRAAAEA